MRLISLLTALLTSSVVLGQVKVPVDGSVTVPEPAPASKTSPVAINLARKKTPAAPAISLDGKIKKKSSAQSPATGLKKKNSGKKGGKKSGKKSDRPCPKGSHFTDDGACVECGKDRIFLNGKCVMADGGPEPDVNSDCPRGSYLGDNGDCLACGHGRVFSNGRCRYKDDFTNREDDKVDCPEGSHKSRKHHCVVCGDNRHFSKKAQKCVYNKDAIVGDSKGSKKKSTKASVKKSAAKPVSNPVKKCPEGSSRASDGKCIVCGPTRTMSNGKCVSKKFHEFTQDLLKKAQAQKAYKAKAKIHGDLVV